MKINFTNIITAASIVFTTSTVTLAADKKPAAAAEIKPANAHVIKLEVKEVDGKKVWSPASTATKVNEPVTVEAHNALTAPHGLTIQGFVPETTIGAGETKTFTFTPTKKGDLKVHCQLHPAHVDSVIKVQ